MVYSEWFISLDSFWTKQNQFYSNLLFCLYIVRIFLCLMLFNLKNKSYMPYVLKNSQIYQHKHRLNQVSS